VGDRRIDLRVASLRAALASINAAERVVLRLLDKSARLYTLPEIGMDSDVLVRFREAIRLEHGLVLVTGPTGSGKSTTLYGALQEINSRESNIVTLAISAERSPQFEADRVPNRWHQPDPDQRQKGPHLRRGIAERAAAGSGRDHGRRNPRP